MTETSPKLILPAGSRPTSLALRAFLAILLTIGFYGLALAIAGALLFVVYAQVVYLERINLRATVLCLLGAGTILWAIAPRVDRFTPPGARLLPAQHPRLFQMIQALSKQVGQKPPAEVYMIADVNAFVAERGGFLGIGRKRVMGIGLPLFETLTVAQLQAILAHEFGHFYGGDTSLGPWIYKTRMAIIRTIAGLGKSWLQAPFRWYGEMFIRVTQAISRRQELVADALAASVAGKAAIVESLKAVAGLAPAFAAYWQNEVIPVFNGGYLPPLANGFNLFTRTNQISTAIQNFVNEELQTGKSSRYDSHPALNERIRAIETLPDRPALSDNAPASGLINSTPDLEREMLTAVNGSRIASLKPVAWADVSETVYLKNWEAVIQQHQAAITGLAAANLPEFRQLPSDLSRLILSRCKQPMNQEAMQGAVDYILGITIVSMLVRSGWKIISQPGCDFTLLKDSAEIQPMTLVRRLAKGEISPEDWKKVCAEAGIAELIFQASSLPHA